MNKPLTARQQEIWDLLRSKEEGGEGLDRHAAAARLEISVNVISKTYTIIRKKLGIAPNTTPRAIETKNPEKAAAAIVALTDPAYKNLSDALTAAGMPERMKSSIIRRLQVKYHGAVSEVRNLQTRELSDMIGQKIHLMLGYLDDRVAAEASARDLSMGIAQLVEKRQLLRGEPTQIVSDHERAKLHELAPVLMAEIKRRGLTIQGEITEKLIEPARSGA